MSSIRVQKFASSTEFKSSKVSLDDFTPPFTLKEGLQRTLHNEFVICDPDAEIFLTE